MSDPCQTRGSSGIVMTSMPFWNWEPGCPRTGRKSVSGHSCRRPKGRLRRRLWEGAPAALRARALLHSSCAPVEVQLPQLGVSIVRAAHPRVRRWLARHPRWTFHFTPTSASWLNAVEGFFAKLTRQHLKRGVFQSVVDLQLAINRFVAETNADPKPFVWTADPNASSPPSNVGSKRWSQSTRSFAHLIRDYRGYHEIECLTAAARCYREALNGLH